MTRAAHTTHAVSGPRAAFRRPVHLVVVACLGLAGLVLPVVPARGGGGFDPTYAFEVSDPKGVAPLYPAGGDVAPDGTRFVADSGRSRIVTIGDRGRQQVLSGPAAGWNDPRDIEVDVRRPQLLWVANTSANEIVKLNRAGDVLARIDGLTQPYGIANDRGGVYVADTYAGRVVKIAKKTGNEKWAVPSCFGSGLLRPRDVAVGSNGDIYVVDTDNDRVVRLSPAGECLAQFGTFGADPGELNAPRAIVSDGAGGLWIAEGGNERIQHFTNGGAFVPGSDLGGFGNASGEFRSPHCVFMDGRLVSVCDTFNFRIQRFRVNDAGVPSFHSIVGGTPPARGGFNGAFDVAYGPDGTMYAADWFNHRIQKFDANGNVEWAVGRYGTPAGSFIFPRGVVVDGGTLVVTDSENSRIDFLDTADGSFISSLKPSGTSLVRPHQTALTPGGTYWVADTGGGRLLHLQASGTVLADSSTWPDGDEITGPPRGVAVDDGGNVYVSTGNRVLKFSGAGTLLDVLAGFGDGASQVRGPYGLRIVGEGAGAMLLIADRGNHRVVVLELDGTPVTTFGAQGTGNGRLLFPQGVDMSPTNGEVAVADFGNDRLSVWTS